MSDAARMVIVGAGHTGGRAAFALREAGWDGAISLIGTEPHRPYERPPLSKDILTGRKSAPDCALYAAEAYRDRDIDLRTSVTVQAIDLSASEVVLSDGKRLGYRRLLLATGAEPRRLDIPGATLDGVQTLRSLADTEALGRRLAPGARIVVIGGGFIGLEVTASAMARGAEVTVVEAGPRLLTRAVPPAIAEQVLKRHLAAGVAIRLNRQATRILGGDRVSGVCLDDGTEVASDLVLVAIGVVPRTGLAEAAGLAIDNGIAVDATLRTVDPAIFAAGDACSFDHPLFGRIRLESWKNAEDHGPLAARNMLDETEECRSVPWMWSDQYDWTIQIAGLPDRATHTVERPVGPGAMIAFHLAADGALVGTSGLGENGAIGRTVRLGQMMIERGLCPAPEALADPAVNLKALLRKQAA